MPATQRPMARPTPLNVPVIVHEKARTSIPSSASDTVLADRVRQALGESSYPSLRSIDVVAIDGLVILTGRVPTWHLKQVGQTTVMSVPGVKKVRNGLDVVSLR